jgi:hypothetical protein
MSIMAFSTIMILGQSTDAFALNQLRITADGAPPLTITDNDGNDLDGDDGEMLVAKSLGCLTSSLEITKTKPVSGDALNPDLFLSFQVESDVPTCNMIIEFTDTDFNADSVSFFSGIGGTTQGTVDFASYIDLGNVEFEKTTEVFSDSYNTLSFGSSGNKDLMTDDAYSATMEIKVTHNGAEISSGSAFLKGEGTEDKEWEAETSSDPNGVIKFAQGTVVDTVNISTTNGVEGDSFTATWTLEDKDGNLLKDQACDAPGLLDANGDTTITCTADGADFGKVGEQTCWTITIMAPDGYVAAAGQDNPLVGTFAKTPLECFIVEQPTWDASTSSDPQGKIFFPVDEPVDTVTINADADVGGTFTGTWHLVNTAETEIWGDCEGGVVQANGEATLTCTADKDGPYGIIGEETCWTIDITAPKGLYSKEFESLDGTGIAAECFNMVDQEGLTPGFYKNNWDTFCDQTLMPTMNDPPYGDCSWTHERGNESFKTAFGLSEEIELRSNDKKNPYETPTLREALDANGGGVNALARHCVAAKLNAEHPAITYYIPIAQDVIDMCAEEFEGYIADGNKHKFGDLKNELDEHNNNGTEDVSQHWPDDGPNP